MAHKRIVLDHDSPLRSLRERLGMTQHEAAALLGTGRSDISNAELRGAGVTVKTLVKILAGYGRRLQLVAIDDSDATEPAEEEK